MSAPLPGGTPGQAPRRSDFELPNLPARVSPPIDWKKLIPGLRVSLAAVVVILLVVNPLRVLAELGRADLRWVGLSALFGVVWLAVRAVFWRSLLPPGPAWPSVFFTVNEGYLLNNFLPFRLGEIGRAYLLSRKSALKFWQIIPSIVIERTLDLGIAAAIFLGALPFAVQTGSANSIALLVAASVLVGLGLLFQLARRPDLLSAFAQRLARLTPRLGKLIQSQLPAFLDGLKILADGRRFLQAVGWLLLNWSISVLQVALLLRAFFPQAQFSWTFFILGSLALGNAAPSTPGAIGMYELAITGALWFFHVDPNAAAAFAVLSHLFNYLFSGAIGGYALGQEKIGLSGLFTSLLRRSRGEE